MQGLCLARFLVAMEGGYFFIMVPRLLIVVVMSTDQGTASGSRAVGSVVVALRASSRYVESSQIRDQPAPAPAGGFFATEPLGSPHKTS